MNKGLRERRQTKVFNVLLIVFITTTMLMFFSGHDAEANGMRNTAPEVKITDMSFYAAWGMSTLHHVTIENPTDVAYQAVKVKIDYYLSYYPTESYTATVVIPVNIEPNSKGTYLEKGMHSLIVNPNGIYGMHLVAGKVEVIGVLPASTT